MTSENQVYKCDICGNTVRIMEAGVGELLCCDQLMELLTEEELS